MNPRNLVCSCGVTQEAHRDMPTGIILADYAGLADYNVRSLFSFGLSGTTTGTADTVSSAKEMSLVDIFNSRPDLQKAFGDEALTSGTEGNHRLNDWWNQHGKHEYPNLILGNHLMLDNPGVAISIEKPKPVEPKTWKEEFKDTIAWKV